MSTRRLLLSFGTRPEAIKLAPVATALRNRGADLTTCAIAQHRELLDQALHAFGMRPDIDLDVMEPAQDIGRLTARILGRMGEVLDEVAPDVLVVQGDTTAALASALAAHGRHIAVAHVEAGLRTSTPNQPWPEEMNRRIITRLARLHFAPTNHAADNLRSEGVSDDTIVVTGNTSIDALRTVEPVDPGFGRGFVVVTCHRREHHEDGFRAARRFLEEVAGAASEMNFVLPLHPNPSAASMRTLAERPNVSVVPPLPYPQMLGALHAARAVITDSGGLQEECAYIGTPCLVMRPESDRPESVESGNATVVNLDVGRTIDALRSAIATGVDDRVFGDGRAAERIAERLLR